VSVTINVGVVLVNWNGWRDCVECLDTLLAVEHPAFHVYLVDNDSKDRSVEHILDWCARPRRMPEWQMFEGLRRITAGVEPAWPVGVRCVAFDGGAVPAPVADCRVTIVRSGGNLGFAGGNNVGVAVAAAAGHSHYWLLNTDTVVPADALAMLVERAQADPRLGLVGSTLVYYAEPEKVQALGGGLDRKSMRPYHVGGGIAVAERPADPALVESELSYVVGASMLVTHEFVQAVGPMADDYFLYYEEIDWAYRARGSFGLGYAPCSIVYHKGGSTSLKVQSRFSLEMLYRNRLKFVARHDAASFGRVRGLLALELLRLLVRGNFPHARAAAKALRESGALYRAERQRNDSSAGALRLRAKGAPVSGI